MPRWRRYSAALTLTFSVLMTGADMSANQGSAQPAATAARRAWVPSAAEPSAIAVNGRTPLHVDVRFDVLREAASNGGTLEIQLTSDLTVRMSISAKHSNASDAFVAGPIADGHDGEATFTIVGDALVGRIVVDGRVFVVRRAANSALHLVTEMDQSSFPPEGQPLVPPSTAAVADQPMASPDSNAFVDLMVLYTPAAKTAAGGSSSIVAELIAAVNNANLALANAGVVHRYRLTHYEEMAYTETNNMNDSLNRLTTSGDGYMDGVFALRDQYHADVVTLMTTDSDACGLGWLMSSSNINSGFAPYAYNINLWSCSNGNLSLAHEIGHNMGLNHDRPNAGGTPAYSYAYGYGVTGVARDVMAYPSPCSCPRKAIFSTPLFNFPGVTPATPAGTATEDNARALNGTSPTVANFRRNLVRGDFDDDSKADAGIFRPSTGGWWVLSSSTSGSMFQTYNFGASGDVPVPADYDGDGKTDVAVFRPSEGRWYVLKSSTGFASQVWYNWGVRTDMVAPGDYDGDGKADLAIYRPSSGQWFILRSSSNYTTYDAVQWGVSTDVPVPADYDGDGKTDVALYRPSAGQWLILQSGSGNGPVAYSWGTSTDQPVPADFDGDGKADLGIYRPSAGQWFVLKSSTGFTGSTSSQWGVSSDVPVPGDYDGDGKADVAVFRPSAGVWFVLNSSTNGSTYQAVSWGANGDIPLLKRP
jgi:hypothetical protein